MLSAIISTQFSKSRLVATQPFLVSSRNAAPQGPLRDNTKTAVKKTNYPVHPLIRLGCHDLHIACFFTPQLRYQNPSFELDIEQNAIHTERLLIKEESE